MTTSAFTASWPDLKRQIRFLHPLDDALRKKEKPEPEISLDVDLVIERAATESALARELEHCPAARYLLSLTSLDSQRSQASQLRKIAQALGAWDWHLVDWAAVREPEFAGILNLLRGREKSAASFNSARAAFRGVMRSGMLMGVVEPDVYTRCQEVVKRRRRERRSASGRYIPIEEQQTAIKHIWDTSPTYAAARNIAVVKLALDLGLRRSEIVDIDLKDWERSEDCIKIHGKGARERVMFLSDDTSLALDRWLEQRGNWPGPLFCPIKKNGGLVKKRLSGQFVYKLAGKASEALPAGFSPHDCRRTFISDSIEANGGDLSVAKDVAGHTRVDTTVLYDRRDRRIMKRAMDRLSDYRATNSSGEKED